MPCMGNLSIRIPDGLKKQLCEYCRDSRRSASDVVRDSLQRHLAAERFQALRRKTFPFAEAQGIPTDEDVFRIVS